MRKLAFFTSMCVLCGVAMTAVPVHADDIDLDTALQQTYIACVGIDDGLADMKKMAGINTAVSGVGTGLAVGAAVVGFSKEKLDKEIDKLTEALNDTDAKQNGIVLAELDPNFVDKYFTDPEDGVSPMEAENRKGYAVEKSKKLGNWRTALMAGSTATQVASAIIAAKNRVSDDLQGQVNDCITSVKQLQRAIAVARMNMVAKEDAASINEAQQIYSACREYEYVDLSPINKRAKGAMISSTIAAATGLTGTVTSAMANSDNVRSQTNEDGTRSNREKNLNKASNALAVGSGVAGAAATIFNATQISAIKKVAAVSEKCTEVLQ